MSAAIRSSSRSCLSPNVAVGRLRRSLSVRTVFGPRVAPCTSRNRSSAPQRDGWPCDGLSAHALELDITEPPTRLRAGGEARLTAAHSILVVPAQAVALARLVDRALLISGHLCLPRTCSPRRTR